MLKFNHLRKNLLIFLLMTALCPMALQRLVTILVHVQGFYSNGTGSVSRSLRRSYGQSFLHQINSQALESVRENFELKSKNYISHDIPKIRFVFWVSVKTAPAFFAKSFVLLAASSPFESDFSSSFCPPRDARAITASFFSTILFF